MDIGLTPEAFKTRSLLAQRRESSERAAADASWIPLLSGP